MPQNLEQLCGSELAAGGARDLAEVASRVAAEVLETMFFAEAVPSACSHTWLGAAVSVRIRFEGSHSGQMRLSASGDAADSIACAFLGLEPAEITGPLLEQVILELANILCGAILSQLWPESKLALGAPQIDSREPLANEPSPGQTLHRCFELPEGKLAMWIQGCEAAG